MRQNSIAFIVASLALQIVLNTSSVFGVQVNSCHLENARSASLASGSAPAANETGSGGGLCLCQTRDSGTTSVTFFNNQSHSNARHISFPTSCQNPHIVAQSYTSWLSCGNGSGPTSCLNNAANIYTLLRPMVYNVNSSGFDLILSADDTVWVGASSPSFKIAYQYTCDNPSGAMCACDATVRGGTSHVRYTNGNQVSSAAGVALNSCAQPVPLTQSYVDSARCGNGSGYIVCPNAPASVSTDIFSVLGSAVTANGFSVADVADDPLFVGAISPAFPIAHQTYCGDHPDPSGNVVGGRTIVGFYNGHQNSTSARVSLPPNCVDPRIVTQSYSSNVRCGDGSGPKACVNNPANSYTYLKSYVGNINSTGFDVYLAADDQVWVGAQSPAYMIGYQVYCSTTECQDAIDNDNDGLVDAADPGCWSNPHNPATYDPTRDNEGAATTQCQDSLDNDSDGVTDASDPGCWADPSNPATYDRRRNNEGTATTQCQDALDNDSDGLIDASDPGCWSNPHNPGSYDRTDDSESSATTQCQDGLDNDADGVADAGDPGCWSNPNNPSTYDKTDNSESTATTQCQDAADNDGDIVKDAGDPGCWTNPSNPTTYDPTRNNEAAATTQCQDGIDNDGDVVRDASDPGCWSHPNNPATYEPSRNNEAAATTQCQDAADNDSDGLIDAIDPGCWTNPVNSSTYDPTRNNEASATSECQDGIDNDQDGKIDMADPGCSNPQDNTENSNVLAAPTNLQASDNNKSGISVSWNSSPGAASYDVYRSEEPSETEPVFFVKVTSTGTNSYFDTAAVPGRIYNYAVKAVSGSTTSTFSNVDAGIRPSDIPEGDCDGDGVSDAQETIDGTVVCDGGSFALHLKSPAFSKYNTYLSQQNYLELVGDGTLAVQNMRVTAYSLQGQAVNSTVLTVQAQTQVDLDINALVGQKDTYGVVKIDFDDAIDGATLKGRMSNYRPDPAAATYSFAFTKELRNPTRGDTFAGANSYDPQGLGFLVPNWMEVINLDSVDRAFVYSLYNQSGQLLQQTNFVLPPLGERDIQAGHEFGQGVYLGVVQPLNGESKYFAGISRYSSNSTGGSEAQTYNYAFNLEARAGNGSSQYATIANELGGCFSQSNWFEVVNVRSIPVTAFVSFRDQAGNIIGSDAVQLHPKSQFHFNAGALLPKGSYGSVKLASNMSGSLVAQSLVYFHDCSQNRVGTAYAVQGRIAGQDVQTGSINSFLGMVNHLRLINSSESFGTASVTARPFGSAPLLPLQLNLNAGQTLAVITNGANASFPFPANTYGTLKIQTAQPKKLVPYVLRSRLNPDSSGRMDFVIPVVIQ